MANFLSLHHSPLISVIIPVFNCKEFLDRCVNSVIDQSYSKLDIILIDDGSTDGGFNLCDSFELKDDRIRVFHIPHGGVGKARNTGLEHAKGEYIAFVDADDYVSPSLLESLYCALLTYEASIATCHHCDIEGEAPSVFSDQILSTTIIDSKEYCFTAEYSHSTVWGVLFRSELLSDLRFDTSIKVGEDSLFLAQAILKADCVVDIDNSLYYYSVRPDSLSHKTYDRDRLTDVIVYDRIIELFYGNSEASLLSCYGKRSWVALRNYRKNCLDNGIDNNLNEELIDYLRKDLHKAIKSPLPLRLKFYVLAFSMAPKLLMKVYLQFENNMRS